MFDRWLCYPSWLRHLMWSPLLASACVYPAQDPTGVELSWRFIELNENDLDPDDEQDFTPIRTCLGAMIDTVTITLVDTDDPTRAGTFTYNCDDGFQTPDEAQTEASDAFLELRPGGYEMVVSKTDTTGREEVGVTRELDVLSRTLTIEALDLARPLTQWRVQLNGAMDCGEVQFRLRYADPEGQLGEPPLNDDGEVQATLYRENLASDRGLSLGGAPYACAPGADGRHTFMDVDIGNYTLEVIRDGQICALGVLIDYESPEFPIDLANLPCEG